VPHDPWQGKSPAKEKPQEWHGPGGDRVETRNMRGAVKMIPSVDGRNPANQLIW